MQTAFSKVHLPGRKAAKDARIALENKTGRKVVTVENILPPSKQKKELK